MSRTFIATVLVASFGFGAQALADASRSFTAQGPYGGSASASTTCAYGAGCAHSASRTTPHGHTATRSVSGYPAYPGATAVVVAPGRGLNLGGPVNRVGPR